MDITLLKGKESGLCRETLAPRVPGPPVERYHETKGTSRPSIN